MPELIAGGPIIPVHLLNELDSGNVVFFCGAGISAGPGSGLPNFEDLVKHVYKANHIKPDPVESEALDLEQSDPKLRRPSLDKVLGLLERDERLGTAALRRTVIQQISVPPNGELGLHKALIDLSRNERGVRLITTNFDNRFVEAGLEEELVDAAPKLPVPKPHTWSSLVHLHGRIVPNQDGSNLVLTSADFGRAYLTERWAARFITELFREFTVVFVGYSVGDPVMSYMVDAIAAERTMGARFAKAYAFADEDGTDAGRSKAQDGWRAKNVEPILYDKRDDHHLLADTLVEWARVRKDRLHARSRIAINEIARMPAGPDDPVVERVVWALQDPVAAKALAVEPPVVDEDEFTKLEKWLEIFAETGLLSCDVDDIETGTSDRDAGIVWLVDNGLGPQNPDNLDKTRRYLSAWLARHLHVPQLLAWVLRNGGHLHPYLRWEVMGRLADKDSEIPARLRLLWTVLLDNKPANPWKELWTSDHYVAAASESERLRIEDGVMESIAPRLVVQPGPPPMLAFRRYFQNEPRAIRPIDSCGHLRLVSGDEDCWHRVKKILQDPGFLSRHAETLTGYLERALCLGEEDDEIGDSLSFRNSIADDGQNSDDQSCGRLINLVRDSYFALTAVNRRQANNLLLRWAESRQPLFRRLALHALTENPKSEIQLVRKLLLEGRKPGLWDPEIRWEMLRLFRLAGKRVPRSLRAEIVRAIHAGTKSKRGKYSTKHNKFTRRVKEILLYNLSVSGVRLDKKSRALVNNVTPGVKIGDVGYVEDDEGGWIGVEEFAPKELVQGSVADIAAVLDNGEVSQDGLRGLTIRKRVKVVSALRRLAKQGKWPANYWQGFLWHLPGSHERNEQAARLHVHVARILAEAPDELLKEVGPAVTGFVNRFAEEYGTERETEFGVFWTKAWNSKGEGVRVTAEMREPLTDALNHPAGKLAEAALTRLRKYEPKTGTGIPVEVRSYFDAIANDPGGHLGRVMLATRLYYLFAIDPDWTTEQLISRLNAGQSQEAADLWSAYGWSPSIGPNLLSAFKEPFLQILRNETLVGQKHGNLISLFMTVCMEAPGELTEEEIRSVVDTFSEISLTTLLGSLKKQLSGKAVERGVIWQDKLYPWLRDYWPQVGAQNTAKTSIAILDMLVECGDGFPQAAKWSLDYLRPLEGNGLYGFCKTKHAAQHPDEMIRVLEKVVNVNVLPNREKHPLLKILNTLVAANSGMAEDQRFQKLYQIATG